MNRDTIKHAFLASLPVLAGYNVLGIGFGILLAAQGYSFWWSILMSVTIFAGSMQYVGVDLLAGGASILSTALMTLMVNARHLFYGVSMLEKYKDMGWRKPYMIFGLTDETYSILCTDPELPETVNRKNFDFLLTLMNQCYWVCGSFIGAFLGNTLEFNSKGVEFSMTALFVIIFVEQWEKAKSHLPALWGLGITFLCLLIFGSDRFLIPSMVLITIGLLFIRRILEKGGKV